MKIAVGSDEATHLTSYVVDELLRRGHELSLMGARRWNDANVLAMSLRSTSPDEAIEILDAWFSAPHGDADDVRIIDMLREMDAPRSE